MTRSPAEVPGGGGAKGGGFGSLAWLALVSLGSNIAGLALPIVLIHVYDRILPNAAQGTALVLFSGVALAILADGFLRYARSLALASRGMVAEHGLALRLAADLLRGRGSAAEGASGQRVEERFAAISRSRDVLVGQSALAFSTRPSRFFSWCCAGSSAAWWWRCRCSW